MDGSSRVPTSAPDSHLLLPPLLQKGSRWFIMYIILTAGTSALTRDSPRSGSPSFVMNPKLIDYIRTQTVLGKTPEDISQALITQGGWTKEEVAAAFTAFRAERKAPEIAVVREEYHPLAASTVKTPSTIPEVKPTAGEVGLPEGSRTSRRVHHFSLRTTLILIAVFLLLAATAVYGYFVYLPTMNQPSLAEALPEIARGTAALPSASYVGSYHATGTFNYMKSSPSATTDPSTRMTGSFDMQVPFSFSYIKADPANEGDIKLHGRIEPYVAFSMPPLSFVASATSSLIVVDKTFYVRLDDISEIMLIPFDFSQLTGVWIKITDTLRGGVVGGVQTYRYRFQIDPGRLFTLYVEEARKEFPNEPHNIPPELDRELAVLPPLWGDLWIDRDTLALRRFTVAYRVSTTTPLDSDTVTEFDISSLFTIERQGSVPSAIAAPADSVTPEELMDTIRFSSLLKDLDDSSTTTEAVARELWSGRNKLMESYPDAATSSRSYRRYPPRACKDLGLSPTCRIGPASSWGNTFVLWRNLSGKRILCVDEEDMEILAKPLNSTEYHCPSVF